MNITVKEFISYNKNTNVKWKIDDNIFVNSELIPKDLLEQQVFDWIVNQGEGIIEVNTYHQVIMRKIQNSNKKE